MVSSNATVNGTTLWASAGAGYYYEEEIWIGQASYTAITDEPVSYIFFKWEKIPPVAFQLQELV